MVRKTYDVTGILKDNIREEALLRQLEGAQVRVTNLRAKTQLYKSWKFWSQAGIGLLGFALGWILRHIYS
jgi:hypothetical protein